METNFWIKFPFFLHKVVFLGFKFEDIATCYQWMTPFARATLERGEIQMKHFVDITDDDMHNIQTHVVDLDLLVSFEHDYSKIDQIFDFWFWFSGKISFHSTGNDKNKSNESCVFARFVEYFTDAAA